MLKWLKKRFTPNTVYVLCKQTQGKITDLNETAFISLNTAKAYVGAMKDEDKKDVGIYKIKLESLEISPVKRSVAA